MTKSELINEILSEWAYRVDDGQPNPNNKKHLAELSIVLSEMGLSEIKDELFENLTEADSKQFSNPVLNKVIKYKNEKGEDKEAPVGNLLRLPKGHPGREAAEKLIPADGTPERDAVNKSLGGEKDGKSTEPAGGETPKDGEAPAGGGEEEKAKAAAAMFDPKADPAMGARMDREKAANDKLAQKDKEDTSAEKSTEKPKSDNKPEVEFSEPTNPPPQNEKGVEKDGKIAGTTIETEPKLSEIDPKFLKEKSTEMNKYYEHFKEDKKKAEGEAMAKFGYTPEQVKDLKDDSKKEFEDEVKKHQEPTYNLCKVSLPNSNLFCSGNKGIPRKDMPQFKGEPKEGTQAWDVLQKAKEKDPTATEADGEPYFRQMLADKNIKVTDAEVPSESLKATQTELVGDKVLGMKSVLDAGPSHPAYKKMTAPLYVSKDGYVVDGHHRWAAITAYNMEHPDNPLPLKTMIIDQPIDDAIETSNTFANEFGVAAKSGKQTGTDAKQPPMNEPGRPDTTPPTDKTTSVPNGQVNASAQKAIDKIKDGVKNWSVEEKEFFKKKVHKGNSPERRTFGEAFKHKAKGAWEAIKHGAEHEVHLFKSAGSGVKNFFSGGKVSEEEKKALIGVAKKVAIAAAFGAAGGGLAHGAIAFGKHVMMEFIPHVVAETVAVGAGKAALFAGEEDNDADMMKFIEIISKKLQSEDIPNEIMADAVDSYNENKKNESVMKYEAIIKASVEQLLREILNEAAYKKADDGKFWVKNKKSGEVYTVSTPNPKSHDVPTPGQIKKATADDTTKSAKPAVAPTGKKPPITPSPKKKEPVTGAGLFKDPAAKARLDKEKSADTGNKNDIKTFVDKGVNTDTINKSAQALLNDKERKTFEEFKKDVYKFYTAKTDEQRKEMATSMIEKYKLGSSPNKQKVYLGFASTHDAHKLLGTSKFTQTFVKDLTTAVGGEVGGEASNAVSQALTTAAKPDLIDKVTAKADPFVAKLFENEPLSYLNKKFQEVHGPITKDGKLIGPAGGKNAKEYFKHSITRNKALDNTIRVAQELEKSGQIKPGLAKSLLEHKKEMYRILKDMQVPSKEAAQSVGDSYARLAQKIAEVEDEAITGAIFKQFAEMALYDTETANGDECYLPSQGNFPSGDKVKITRKGTKVEKVQSISVKYGLKNGFYGFPGETAQYQIYHPNPAYRDRNNSHPGDTGYLVGVKDSMVDNDVEFDKMIEESGFAPIIKDTKKFKKVIKDFKKEIELLRSKHNIKTFKDLVPYLKEMKAINEKYAPQMTNLLNTDAMPDMFGPDNTKTLLGGPMPFVTAMSFSGTLKSSGGLKGVYHNHQNVSKEGKFYTHTTEGSPDLKEWKMNFRAYDSRGGGCTASYNQERRNPEYFQKKAKVKK